MPTRGFVFWPVANGDSVTVLIDQTTVLQVDLHHMAQADEESDPNVPVLDRLIELLPTDADGRPRLSGFALTHPDLDHCLGFQELHKRVTIGELWLTPRVFRDNADKALNDEAQAFCEEAMRRVRKTIAVGGLPSEGDRVRIVGWDELLNEDDFEGFPRDLFTVPGTAITGLNGLNYDACFRAFVHAPFKDDAAEERNATSLGLQVTLVRGSCTKRAILLGDLPAPTIKRIFCEVNKEDADLDWDVYLAPHHCSKGALGTPDEAGAECLDQELLDEIERHAAPGAYVVASSRAFRDRDDQPGDDPPHRRAREAYEGIVEVGHFVCTGEHPTAKAPEPVVIAADEDECGYREPTGDENGSRAALLAAVARSRGTSAPPSRPQGFGGARWP